MIVTGAGSGIGRAIALRQAKSGDIVIATDIDEVAAAETAALAPGKVHARRLDVTVAKEWEDLRDSVIAEFGVPDILVSNAGILVTGAFFDQTEQDWNKMLSVNVMGGVTGSRIIGAAMAERGQGGHIVIIASGAAWAPNRFASSYAVTKAAALMLAESLRIDLAPKKIGVSAICPGVIRTQLAANSTHSSATGDPEVTKKFADAQARFSYAGPDAVARAVSRAIAHNLAVVPVNPESYLLWFARRIAPGTSRRVLAVASTSGFESFFSILQRRVPRAISVNRSGAKRP